MLDEDPILDPQDVRGDPIRGRPETGKAAVDDDEIRTELLSDIKAIQSHHLIPRRDEIMRKLLLDV
jgi:hypothetical protein